MNDVAVIMGSQSDFECMKTCINLLKELDISYKTSIVSAHRTPSRLYNFASSAYGIGIKVIIAASGGAAHLPGMVASITHIPVIGVPIKSKSLAGMDSLLSIVQMPKGVPVSTMAIGQDGAFNAALMAASILSVSDEKIMKTLVQWRETASSKIAEVPE